MAAERGNEMKFDGTVGTVCFSFPRVLRAQKRNKQMDLTGLYPGRRSKTRFALGRWGCFC
jgi:hypothetical protein